MRCKILITPVIIACPRTFRIAGGKHVPFRRRAGSHRKQIGCVGDGLLIIVNSENEDEGTVKVSINWNII